MDFSRLAAALEGNAALQRRARLAALSFAVLGGTEPVTVRVGERIVVEKGAAANAAFSLTASPASWAEFAKPVPAVGFQSLVGMQRVGHLRIEGDILAWGRHMLFLEQLFAALRPSVPTPQIRPPLAHRSSSRWSAATCGWTSTAGRIASISRRQGRAFPCSVCTLPAPTAGSTANC